MVARVRAGEVQLGWRQWGEGDVTVVFIHGNLASKDWIELAAPLFPSDVRVIGIDWRGCGESDRPPPAPDFSNDSMRQHALDMLAALDELHIRFCHLATHSTGGIIAARILLKQPERFGRVFALDPVTPLGMALKYRADRLVSRDDDEPGGDARGHGHRCGLAVRPQEPGANYHAALSRRPRRDPGVLRTHPGADIRCVRRRLGSVRPSTSTWNGRAANWSGTWPRSGTRIWCCGARRMAGLLPPISRPWQQSCRLPGLITVPGIGHSMNLESPSLYAGYFGAWFGGLSGSEVAI
jgi:non-heme chloroperoxidase